MNFGIYNPNKSLLLGLYFWLGPFQLSDLGVLSYDLYVLVTAALFMNPLIYSIVSSCYVLCTNRWLISFSCGNFKTMLIMIYLPLSFVHMK